MSIMKPIPRIAIIGAGPAGLTLARLLHQSKTDIHITIYERDAAATARSDQGGTLDLHQETGLAAIRKCNLWNEFSKYARYDGQEMKLADKNATVLAHIGQGKTDGDRPEIDRRELKQILLESVPDDLVKWDHKLTVVTEDGHLRFDGKDKLDGPFALIVGADGGQSKVRAKLSSVQPSYAGVCGLEFEIAHPAMQCPTLDSFIGRGSFFSASDQKLLNAQRMGNGSLKVRSWLLRSEEEAKTLVDKKDNQAVLNVVRTLYTGWAPEITELLQHADPATLRPWLLYQLPVGSKWNHKQGYTLIGDAASLATPFSGEGVNKAMTDALELATCIENSRISSPEVPLDEAVKQYEQSMFPRAHKMQLLTIKNKQAMFRSDAPVGMISSMIETMTLDSPSLLVRLAGSSPVLAIVYSVFWFQVRIGLLVRRYWRRN